MEMRPTCNQNDVVRDCYLSNRRIYRCIITSCYHSIYYYNPRQDNIGITDTWFIRGVWTL